MVLDRKLYMRRQFKMPCRTFILIKDPFSKMRVTRTSDRVIVIEMISDLTEQLANTKELFDQIIIVSKENIDNAIKLLEKIKEESKEEGS